MRELEVILDFQCCYCGRDMGVTLKCSGKGLIAGMHSVTTVKVPCLNCDNNNQVYFTPSGELHRVVTEGKKLELLEPSYN